MVVATRYAKSLLGLALEKGQLEIVYKDMALVQHICKDTREFVLMLESPLIKNYKKQAILHEVFSGKISEMTMTFLDILTTKRREGYIDDIANAFVEQYKNHKKILTAVITSVSGIDEQTRKIVLKLVKEQAQGEVELIEKIDKKLIGGFKLSIGDNTIDASILRKLNDLRKNFNENPFVKEF